MSKTTSNRISISAKLNYLDNSFLTFFCGVKQNRKKYVETHSIKTNGSILDGNKEKPIHNQFVNIYKGIKFPRKVSYFEDAFVSL